MVIHADTSYLIDLLREQTRRRPGRATAFLEQHADDRVMTSMFAVCELEAGASLASAPDRERARLRTLLQVMTVVYPDDRLPMLYGDVLGALRRSGSTVAAMDLLIAALAIVEGAALVTANQRHFLTIPGLVVLDY
jgi:tRNA(fMet)-specific endonuclease VapC